MVHEIADDIWTPKRVGEVLIETAKWSIETGGRHAPACDRNNIFEQLIPDRPTSPYRRHRSPALVSLLEKALHWPTDYLKDHDGAARVLQLWLLCKCSRIPFKTAVDNKGWSRATAYRRRDDALSIISQGLDRDRIGVPKT